jgi:hypothetical protein
LSQTHQKHHHPFSAPKPLIKKIYIKPAGKHQYQKKKLHFNLDTIQEDRSSCSDDFPDLPDLHCPFTPGNKRPAEDVSTHTPESLPPKKIKLEFSAPKIQEHILSDTSPWIGSLTQKDKNIIAGKQWLTSKIIEEVHDILSKQLALINGFQTPCNAPAYNTTLKSGFQITVLQNNRVQPFRFTTQEIIIGSLLFLHIQVSYFFWTACMTN